MSSTPLSPLLQQALRFSQGNDVDAAIELLIQAKKEDPASAWTCFFLGAQLAQLGRYDEAEAEYANAVLLAPDLAIARYELGTLQFTSGRAAVALLTWQALLSLPSHHYFPLFVSGYAALAQDRFADAISQFELGIAANNENAPLNENIRLLINRLRPATDNTPELTADSDEPGPPSEETPTEHFLISGYGRHLH